MSIRVVHKLEFAFDCPGSINMVPYPLCYTEGHIKADRRWKKVTCKRCLKRKA